MYDRRSTPAHVRFAALDGWRGICALMVALHHLHGAGHLQSLPIVQNSHLFVDFFFVLSGFVVSHAYLDKLATADQAMVMLWRRFARLWPLHVAMLVAFVLLELGAPLVGLLTGLSRGQAVLEPNSSALPGAIATNLLLVHGLGVHDRLTWNFPSWSISTEFWTYLVFALVMLLGRQSSKWLAVAIAALGAGVVASCSSNFMATHYDFGFFRCLYGFFVGHLVYLAARTFRPRLPFGTAIECAAAFVVGAYISVLGETAWSLAAPLVIGGAVWIFAQERGAVSVLLRTRPLAALGAWSYSIYMVHSLVLGLLHRGLSVVAKITGAEMIYPEQTLDGTRYVISVGNAYMTDLLTLAYLAVVIALAALTWRTIEMPAQRLLNRQTPRLPSATARTNGIV